MLHLRNARHVSFTESPRSMVTKINNIMQKNIRYYTRNHFIVSKCWIACFRPKPLRLDYDINQIEGNPL